MSKTQAEKEEKEEERIEENLSLPAPAIYEVVKAEGIEELRRPPESLWWSGVAAGLCISFSVLCEAFLHHYLPDEPWRPLVENFGYCLGFLIVIMGRMQLFTENTITVILPLLEKFSRKLLIITARLWAIVLSANLTGTFILALVVLYGGLITPDFVQASLDISHHLAEKTPSEMLLHGIPAGFLVATLVWIMPNSEASKLFAIILLAYVIALGEFSHVVAGSTEIFLLMLNGELTVFDSVFLYILPALVGNVIGGTGLFTMLAYGQVHEEFEGD